MWRQGSTATGTWRHSSERGQTEVSHVVEMTANTNVL